MEISEYFSTVWKGDFSKYKFSGPVLADKIERSDKVLDVGCGYNPFKDIPNVFGIDPYNSNADLQVSIEDFVSNTLFDKIFCLGSINFGDKETIEKQIEKVVSLLKPGGIIYWRQNPGLADHGNEECKDIQFYPWNFKQNFRLAKKYGCKIEFAGWDTDNRIYAEWRKL